MPTTPFHQSVADSDLRSHEINRLQRAMHHMLTAHQMGSNVSNGLRAEATQLHAKVEQQAAALATSAAKYAALEAQMEAVWSVAIKTAANVAEFTCQSTSIANAIRQHADESATAIAEMVKAAKGE